MGSGEQQHKKFSLLGFAHNKFMGEEYSLRLGVSSGLSRRKPETSQRLPDDGGAFPVLQRGTLQLQNELRTTRSCRGLEGWHTPMVDSHQQNSPAPFCAARLNGAIDIFRDICPVISAITACHHHCKFTQPETILNLNCILKNYYPPPLCKLAI